MSIVVFKGCIEERRASELVMKGVEGAKQQANFKLL